MGPSVGGGPYLRTPAHGLAASGSAPTVDRFVVVVDVRRRGVVLLLLVRGHVVSVHQRGVIVLVAVIARAVLELVLRATHVVVAHVVVVVGVDLGRVHVLLVFGHIADGTLLRRLGRSHLGTSDLDPRQFGGDPAAPVSAVAMDDLSAA